MSRYNPQPRQKSKQLPKRLPKKVISSHIGERDIVGNWLIYCLKGGDYLHDFSPYKNYGTINGAKWVSTKKGWGLKFVGSESNYVEIPDDPSLDMGTGDFTVLVWIKTTNTTDNFKTIVDKGPNNYTGNPHWTVYQNGGSVGYSISDPDNKVEDDTGTINDGRWHYVVVVADRDDNVKLYIDANKVLSQDMTSVGNVSNDSPTRIGGNDNWGRYYTGKVVSVRIVDRVLSESEIRVGL